MATISEQISSSADDGFYDALYGQWFDTLIRQGDGPGDYEYTAGFRFGSISIPQGASVSTATLTVVRVLTSGAGNIGYIFGYDTDDAAAWSSSVHPVNMAKTAASTAMVDTDTEIDVQAQVQEIVDRGGWVSGNNLSLGGGVTGATQYVRWTDYGDTPGDAAILDVEYSDNPGDLFLRPASTQSAGNWTNELGGTTLHTSIDEETIDDDDYIRSESTPSSDKCIVKLDSGNVDTDQEVRIRYRYKKEGGGTINITVGVESPVGTQRASQAHNGISGSFVNGTLTLSTAEAEAVDWSDAYLTFTATEV